MMHEWNTIYQLIFLTLFSAMLTIITIELITSISQFLNETLCVLFRGYAPAYEEVKVEDEKAKTDGDKDGK